MVGPVPAQGSNEFFLVEAFDEICIVEATGDVLDRQRHLWVLLSDWELIPVL